MQDRKIIEILLVEDNPDDEELAMMAFKENKISNKVHVARDGVQALEYLFDEVDGKDLRDNQPKIVLLDLKLPKIDGLEVLKKIKSHPEAKSIPVIILTSSNQERDMVESYKLGVNSYIQKPVEFTKFVEVVRDLGFYWMLLNKMPDEIK